MVNFEASLPTHKEAHTELETPVLFPPTQSSIWAIRGQAANYYYESELVRSSSFAKKNNEEVSDWYHASKH